MEKRGVRMEEDEEGGCEGRMQEHGVRMEEERRRPAPAWHLGKRPLLPGALAPMSYLGECVSE